MIVVLTITAPINWFLWEFLLDKGALVWISQDFKDTDLGLPVLGKIEKTSPIPLSISEPILGGSLFMVEREYTISETVVYGFGSGVGFFLAIVALASIRYRIRYSNIPPRLRGVGMAMLLTGLLSMAFMAFSGIDL